MTTPTTIDGEDMTLTIDQARSIAAQCWCAPETSGIEMDARLAEVFARALLSASKPAAPAHCQCAACKDGAVHASDCAVHNASALPIGECDCSTTAPAQSAHPDDQAVDRFAAAMKEKLAQARAKGRGGWQQCDSTELSIMLREHVEKGDPRDVANFCMFLWCLGQPISDAALPMGKRATSAVVLDAERAALRRLFEAAFNAGWDRSDECDNAYNNGTSEQLSVPPKAQEPPIFQDWRAQYFSDRSEVVESLIARAASPQPTAPQPASGTDNG